MVHALKTDPIYYEAARSGKKKFEVRYNDKNFKVGDYVALNELDDTRTEYTGRSLLFKITYILNNESFCKSGYVILGIEMCSIRANNEMQFPPICELGGTDNG